MLVQVSHFGPGHARFFIHIYIFNSTKTTQTNTARKRDTRAAHAMCSFVDHPKPAHAKLLQLNINHLSAPHIDRARRYIITSADEEWTEVCTLSLMTMEQAQL